MTTLSKVDIERIRRRLQREQEKADAEALHIKTTKVLNKHLKGKKKHFYQVRMSAAKLLARI